MIRTQIELWPYGSEDGKKVIADICIANVGEGVSGNYTYVYMCKSDRDGILKGKVYNHERKAGIFPLMERVYEMIRMGNGVHHFFTEYELRVLEGMEKRMTQEKEGAL